MKKITPLFRLFGTIALLSLTAGCTTIYTRQPFGEIDTIGKDDATAVNGTWYSPVKEEKKRMILTVALEGQPDKPAIATLKVRTKEGEQVYEARIHKVKTGVKGSPETIVFFRPQKSDKPWRFAWLSAAANTDEKPLPVLLAFFPDADAFESLGITLEKDFNVKGYDLFSDEKALLLTDSPDKILAALQGKDLRTFMHATSPYVFVRDNPLPPESSAPPKK